MIQTIFVKVYQVPSASMAATLQPGDRLLVNRMAADPVAGDVVVFREPEGWSQTREPANPFRVVAGWAGDLFGFGPSNERALVKRVVGVPGQTVECCDAAGRVERDGSPIDEPYLSSDLPFEPGMLDCGTSPRSLRCFAPVVVGPNQYLMLGDNRAASSDSIYPCRGLDLASGKTCARLVPSELIVGQVFFVLFPVDRWGQSMSADAPR